MMIPCVNCASIPTGEFAALMCSTIAAYSSFVFNIGSVFMARSRVFRRGLKIIARGRTTHVPPTSPPAWGNVLILAAERRRREAAVCMGEFGGPRDRYVALILCRFVHPGLYEGDSFEF